MCRCKKRKCRCHKKDRDIIIKERINIYPGNYINEHGHGHGYGHGHGHGHGHRHRDHHMCNDIDCYNPQFPCRNNYIGNCDNNYYGGRRYAYDGYGIANPYRYW